jgi:hypothetical protein
MCGIWHLFALSLMLGAQISLLRLDDAKKHINITEGVLADALF